MYTVLETDSVRIEKYEWKTGEALPHRKYDYEIAKVSPENSAVEKELADAGFVFLDRILLFEINLVKLEQNQKHGISDISVTCDMEYTKEMNDIAKKAYTTDRRFHLDAVFDPDRAAPVIDAYIGQCRSQQMKIYKACHDGELLGFTIVDEKADEKGNFFENVLGATTPGIKGKMAAPMLYGTMLVGEKSLFKKYVGRVSSSNAASINLHCQLGGKVAAVYDEYIYRKNIGE